MIRFENATRTYGRKVAVDRLTLSIGRGEIFALLGPNGAGKTTAMKMLVGLLRPDCGTVQVCGCDVAAQTRAASRFLGYVPEEPFLYDKLSGREFLEFAAEMRGLPAADKQARIAREAENFDMADFLDELVETYSHGMKQRLVFASALLHDPAVLVVDEPMVGLDPLSVRVVKDLLRSRAGGRRGGLDVHPHPGGGRGNRRSDRHPQRRPPAFPGDAAEVARGVVLGQRLAGAVVPGIDRRQPPPPRGTLTCPTARPPASKLSRAARSPRRPRPD